MTACVVRKKLQGADDGEDRQFDHGVSHVQYHFRLPI